MRHALARLRSSGFVHPLLFATYPVVFLVARNLWEQLTFWGVFRVLVIVWFGTIVALGLFRLVFKDWLRAALATTALVAVFFSFGHVMRAVDPRGTRGLESSILAEYILLTFILLVLAWRAGRFAPGLTRAMNLIAAVLVAINVAPIVQHAFATQGTRSEVFSLPGVDPAAVTERRDVYYIIFDRYANERTFEDHFGYNDDSTLDWLGRRGFYVARDSVANYPKTAHSLASSLNMTYLDDMAARYGPDSDNWAAVYAALRNFRVAQGFEELGYRYYHMGSWWEPTRLDPTADVNYTYGNLSEFSSVLLDTTIWPTLSRRLGITDEANFEQTQYRRVLYQFDSIASIEKDPAPTFTFVHFTLPHPPYVFDARGDFVPPEQAAQEGMAAGYLHQVEYTNVRMKEMVRGLLAGPADQDPIVVIQSDEGPHPIGLELDERNYDWTKASDADLSEKLRILDAYYLPGHGEPRPYPTITPVNTFRMIFDRYFSSDLPMLEDRTYVFKDAAHPFLFSDVTDRLRG